MTSGGNAEKWTFDWAITPQIRLWNGPGASTKTVRNLVFATRWCCFGTSTPINDLLGEQISIA